MRRGLVLGLTAVVVGIALTGGFTSGLTWARALAQQLASLGSDEEPDLPPFVPPNFNKEEFMTRRAEYIAQRRGVSDDAPFDPKARTAAIAEMEKQQRDIVGVQAVWTPLGPAPIPNGGTLSISRPVSGRTIAIAVHPTNPDIVYVGTAQGGLYRSTDGGTNWTSLMDNALSLAIGAIAIAPSQPDTIYVGTGEVGLCGDCFFGVGA